MLIAMGLLIIATALGTPLFVTIGGLALLMFWQQFTPVSAVVVETYRLVADTDPTLTEAIQAGLQVACSDGAQR